MTRDWIKREPDPFWNDTRVLRIVSDGDVLREAGRIVRARGHAMAATVLERWAEEDEAEKKERAG